MWSNLLLPIAIVALGALPTSVCGAGVLKTNGYSQCLANSPVQVQKLDISYTASTRDVVFDVAGSNSKVQNVTASLAVFAYGQQVYTRSFNPCSTGTYVQQLCPVPSGNFAANGSIQIPAKYASQIPSFAFTLPDLEGQVKLNLTALDSGKPVACIESGLTNGKSLQVKGVSYAAVGVAGAAFALTSVSALGTAGHPGASGSSPGFGDVMGWFHTMATNGMLSVSYPAVYRSFSKNFAFSTGLVSWAQMQTAIDTFRQRTGGNLTADSYQYLQNATLVFPDGSTSTARSGSVLKRALHIAARQLTTSINTNTPVTSSSSNSSASGSTGEVRHLVSGAQAYFEELSIPQANTFMTVLLFFAVVIAAIAVGILLFKVVLEVWALFGTFPQSLKEFRQDYWGLLGRTITNLILILYSVWVLYCVFQLTNGDSWAAKILAAVTLTIFTGVLMFFSIQIAWTAHRRRKDEGSVSSLYDDDKLWRKYSLFYDSYKERYWWLFIPVIFYMFAKGFILAAGNGHGLVQTAGQLIVEALMLILLLWSRPYVAKSSQWVSIIIQVVRVLSVGCILVFVEELGISQTTKTITGVVLIAIQSALTGILAILIVVNAIIFCCTENPYEKKRKEAEKFGHIDDLTPLDARDSLLISQQQQQQQQRPLSKDMQERGVFNSPSPYGGGVYPPTITRNSGTSTSTRSTRSSRSSIARNLTTTSTATDGASRYHPQPYALFPSDAAESRSTDRLVQPEYAPAPGQYRAPAYGVGRFPVRVAPRGPGSFPPPPPPPPPGSYRYAQ